MLHKEVTDPQVKLQDGGNGLITFYLSTWKNWDRVRPIPERPTPGAFAPHLATFLKDGFMVVAHDWGTLPVATITSAEEDPVGLLCTAEFHSTAEAQAARTTTAERLARGKSVKTSMGYDVLRQRLVEMDDPTLKAEGISQGRELTDVFLYEASLVNVPANPQADVTRVKGLANPAAVLAAVKSLYDGTTPLDWEAQEILQCLLAYVTQGRLLADADPAALLITASLLREALDTVGTLIGAGPMQTEGKAAPPRRVDFLQEGAMVQRAVALFAKRAEARVAAYARKEGRTISRANRTKLTDLRTGLQDVLKIIDDLLAASEPPAKTGPAWRRERVRLERALLRSYE